MHLYETKQGNFKGSKQATHIDKNWTSHLLGLERDNFGITSAEVSWEHSPCTYTYIHISRAMTLSGVANTCFPPFHMAIYLVPYQVPKLPLLQSYNSLSAAWFLPGHTWHWWEDAWRKVCVRSVLLFVLPAPSHSDMDSMNPRALLGKRPEWQSWGGHVTHNQKGIWQRC